MRVHGRRLAGLRLPGRRGRASREPLRLRPDADGTVHITVDEDGSIPPYVIEGTARSMYIHRRESTPPADDED